MTDNRKPPAVFGFDVRLAGNRQYVTINVVNEREEIIIGHDFDAAELDEIIELFGSARMGLADAVSAMPDPGSRVRTIEKPTVLVQALPPTTDQLLIVRDEAFGWTAFRLKQKLAQTLGRLLLGLPDA